MNTRKMIVILFTPDTAEYSHKSRLTMQDFLLHMNQKTYSDFWHQTDLLEYHTKDKNKADYKCRS